MPIAQPLQSVHINKRDAFTLPLLDALALCGAVSEFNVLRRQAFKTLTAKGMSHQEAVKKLNDPKTKQSLDKVAKYVDEKVEEIEQKEAADRLFYAETLSDEFEPRLIDDLLQGKDVDLSAVDPAKLPLLQDVIAENFCDQSDRLDATLCVLMADLPEDVREIALDYVDDRLQMKGEQAVGTLTRIGNILKTTGQVAIVGTSYLLDPIPGAPIARVSEIATDVSTPSEAYKGIGKDAAIDTGVMTTMAVVPVIPGVGAVIGKVVRNVEKAWSAGKRIALRNSHLLRKAQAWNYERKIGKLNEFLAKKSQRHHIFPQGDEQVTTLFEQIGLSVHDANNIVRLPNKEGALSKMFGKASIHSGRHSQAYTDRIKREIERIAKEGGRKHFVKEEYQAEIYKTMEKLRSELISGDLKLNSVVRPK